MRDLRRAVATFLAKAPLDGKRVALFCTSGGSGLKNMPRDAERLSPKAVFLPGAAFKNGADIAAMDAWVEQLGASEPYLRMDAASRRFYEKKLKFLLQSALPCDIIL